MSSYQDYEEHSGHKMTAEEAESLDNTSADELKQAILTHMLKKYPDSIETIAELNEEEHEMLDFFAEFATSYTKQRERALLERLNDEVDRQIEASENNLKYAEENNHSERTIANWRGCIEGEKFCKEAIQKELEKL